MGGSNLKLFHQKKSHFSLIFIKMTLQAIFQKRNLHQRLRDNEKSDKLPVTVAVYFNTTARL